MYTLDYYNHTLRMDLHYTLVVVDNAWTIKEYIGMCKQGLDVLLTKLAVSLFCLIVFIYIAELRLEQH